MNQYRALDPLTEGPDVMGPSRDWNAIAKRERVWREEMAYNVRPQRLPVSLLMPAARPRVERPVLGGLKPGRVPVLIRDSNVNPQASGQGVGNWKYTVSDPYWAHTAQGRALGAAALDTSAPTGAPITDVSLPMLACNTEGRCVDPTTGQVSYPDGGGAPKASPPFITAPKLAQVAILGTLIGAVAWFTLRR